ncbi:MAG: hypothetical protein JW807_13775 [Spirochaetes bacterium]|nr:hypothetical protein [Spirochaetota bacterium]
MFKQGILHVILVVFVTSCSGQLDRLLPEILDPKGEARLQKRYHDEEARSLFLNDPVLGPALREFNPGGISAGVYDFGGITIHLGMARCSSADDAYGIYSALTARPRERWEFQRGELSYKSPYVAGYTGEYVFWTYSPSNPMTYAAFYRSHGERILSEFEKLRTMPGCSYHWKILPPENRYADSFFYIKSRNVQGIDLINTYGATYQVKQNIATMYVSNLGTDKKAAAWYSKQIAELKSAGKDVVDYIPMPGGHVRACRWKEAGGVWILCQYRWIILFLQDMPSVEMGTNFIRMMFVNMTKVRNEAVPPKDDN